MRRALKTYPIIAIDVKILPCSHFSSFFLHLSLLPLLFPSLSLSDVAFYCTTFVQFMFIMITYVYISSVTYVS